MFLGGSGNLEPDILSDFDILGPPVIFLTSSIASYLSLLFVLLEEGPTYCLWSPNLFLLSLVVKTSFVIILEIIPTFNREIHAKFISTVSAAIIDVVMKVAIVPVSTAVIKILIITIVNCGAVPSPIIIILIIVYWWDVLLTELLLVNCCVCRHGKTKILDRFC